MYGLLGDTAGAVDGILAAAAGAFKALKLQLQVTNLLDKEYFSTVGSNGFVTSDPNGNNYTLLTGAPRQWFFTVDASF